MADKDDLFVTISGPALSMLFYENTKFHDQIGFLLGETLVYVTKKVTDNDKDIEHIKYHINIKTVISFPCEPFYNTVGQIKEDKLNMFLKDDTKNVLGWYHYRREFPLRTTFRDRCLHTELSSFFCNKNNLMTKENFLFCLLNSSVSDIGGTHKFKHLLLQKISNSYKSISLKINNLVEDSTKPDGFDYKPVPKHSSSEPDAFHIIYDSIRNDLKTVSEIECVNYIQHAAEDLLKHLIPTVSQTDEKVSCLEKELIELRNKIYSKKFETINNFNLQQKFQPLSENNSKVLDQNKSPQLSQNESLLLTSKNFLEDSTPKSVRTRMSENENMDLLGKCVIKAMIHIFKVYQQDC